MARREAGDKLPYAEEVLVSKADLEEKKQRIAELDAQVLQLSPARHVHLADTLDRVLAEPAWC